MPGSRQKSLILAATALLAAGCLVDLGPLRQQTAQLAFVSQFDVTGSTSALDVAGLTLRIARTDGSFTLDTTIAIDTDTISGDVVTIELTVVLEIRTVTDDEPPDGPVFREFEYEFAIIGPTGNNLFLANDTILVMAGGIPQPVPVPLRYVGIGFDAVSVVIVNPPTSIAFPQIVTLVAEALDDQGLPIADTPILWESLNEALAFFPDRFEGDLVAQQATGVVSVVARTLTNLTDTVMISVGG